MPAEILLEPADPFDGASCHRPQLAGVSIVFPFTVTAMARATSHRQAAFHISSRHTTVASSRSRNWRLKLRRFSVASKTTSLGTFDVAKPDDTK
jgi:hypothetical protein